MRRFFQRSLYQFAAILVFASPSEAAQLLDDATGGDCTLIGSWDVSTKTCTLTADLNDAVVVLSPGLTLDCANYSISGPALPNFAVFIPPGRDGIIVRNCVVQNFGFGITAFRSNDHVFTNNRVIDNGTGIIVSQSNNNSVTNNSFTRNQSTRALTITRSFNNLVANNTFTNNGFGVSLIGGGSHEVRDNLFVGNGSPQILPAGVAPGVALSGDNSNDNVLTGNVMNDNTYGFGLKGTGNSVDTSNTVDGNSIYWFNDLVGGTITPSLAPGAAGIYCDRCEGVTIRDFELETPMGIGIGLYATTGSYVEDNVISDSSVAVWMTVGSDDNVVLNNEIRRSFEDVFAYGIRLDGADRNLIADNDIDLGPGNSGWHGISLGRDFSLPDLDPSDQNTVTDNTITRTLQHAIEVAGSQNRVEGNSMTDTGGGIEVEGFGVDIIGNIVRENEIRDGRDAWFPFTPSPGTFGHGIYISAAVDTLVERNTVTGMRDNGLTIAGSTGTVVTRNDIYGNARTGLDNAGDPIFEVVSVDITEENPVMIELSKNGIGNYWGRNCGLGSSNGSPQFQAGIDSNSVVVVDSNPFVHPISVIPVSNALTPANCPTE